MSEKHTPSESDYIDLKGKWYLPVPSRVQWFRGEHPTWTIHTSVVELDWTTGYAVLRAEVLDDTGRLIASGMKTETRKGFGDFVEKAETGAVGRALARAGYGTEDALDLEGERIADSPVARTQPERRGGSPSSPSAAPVRTPEEQELLDKLLAVPGMTHARMSLLADAVGVEKGTRATAHQLRQMLARTLDTPEDASAHATPAGEGGAAPALPTTPDDDRLPAVAPATVQAADDDAVPPGTSSAPAPAPTIEDVLEATGGELVPPAKGRTVDEAIADAEARAKKAKVKA